MQETSKTNRIRSANFVDQYLKSPILDIGGGNDPVSPSAEVFDKGDGDAQFILRYKSPEYYNTIYSSHCLEHMLDPTTALSDWWKLLRPGGYMILVVPDNKLYEQGFWPSIFNKDHKSTFSIAGEKPLRGNHFDLLDMVGNLNDVEIVYYELQDQGYNHYLSGGRPSRAVQSLIHAVASVGNRLKIRRNLVFRVAVRVFRKLGYAVDQTLIGGLAQIEIVARKVP